jgi:hypothetical protein
VDPTTAAGSAFAAFGLSGAAGLNAWLPLFAGALLHRWGVVELGAPFDSLSTTPGLIGLGIAFAADFVGDKIPAVDHVLHAMGAVISPVAGAVLFAGQASVGTDVPTVVAVLAGALIAGSVHAGRATARPVSTATTAGLGNPVVSLAEDAGAAGLVLLAFLIPVLAFLAVAGLLVAVVAIAFGIRRRLR